MIDISADTDGDGLKDVVEGGNIDDGFDVNDENVDLLGEFTLADSDEDVDDGRGNADPLNVDYDFREAIDTDGDNVHDEADIDNDNDGILDADEIAGADGSSRLSFLRTNAVITDQRAQFNNPAFTADGNTSATSGLVFDITSATGEPNTEFYYGLSVTGNQIVDTFELRGSVGAFGDFDVRAFDLEIYDDLGELVFSGSSPDVGAIAVAQLTGFSLGEGLYTVVLKPTSSGGSGRGAELAEVGFVGVSSQISSLNPDADNDLILNHRDIDSDNDGITDNVEAQTTCLLYTSPSPRDATLSRMPSSA